ncbi:amidase [Blastococcus sp. VKM Ac-2987]|uniref:amidase n=1 Tax=Blastococcus sp. VKM Ac-2987 TaxID=3004141 RepID=UPI0022AB798E|nr:amidase family protein [Blastococcus sp. VKM Ac-2987]MCZ2859295.1 amidase family protein [Blastococcus sp. VKM Ac-2987]
MSDDDLLFLPATRAAALIRNKELSPVEYVDAVLEAIDTSGPAVNAFATVTAEAARAAARLAEQAVIAGAELGPLHGVPVSIKDLFATTGVRTAYGSVVYADHVPDHDDVLVQRLDSAGAIMVGKSTTPEFGHKGVTDSPVFGVTRNPWDLDRAAGGSSGGAAAAVAAGFGPIGLGTDGAGSIRIPAGACGVVGLKPTTGALPYEQASDVFSNYAAAGPLTRTVADAALVMDCLAGPTTIDPWTLGGGRPRRMPQLTGDDLSGVRIGYIPRMANTTVSDDVQEQTTATLTALADLGAQVDEIGGGIDWIPEAARVLYFAHQFVAYGPFRDEYGDRLDPTLIDFIEKGSTYSVRDYRTAGLARSGLYRSVQGLFDQVDFLVTPTLPTTAPPAVDSPDGREPRLMNGWNAYLYPFNLTGHPAASVPSGFGADGLPTGLQIVGPWWSDADVLRLGAVVESARPWAHLRPPTR